jgi:putative transposase
MQVFGQPSHGIRNGRAASRLLAAKTPNIEAERRRDAVARWRRAMADGLTSESAARAVGEARANLYRWEKRLDPRSRRPARRRKPNGLVDAVERLRLAFPMWGRAKLGPLVREHGFAVSDATVGRIIAQLVARGAVQPVLTLRRRPYARPGPPNAASRNACRATSSSTARRPRLARHRSRQCRARQIHQTLHGL